MIAALRDRIQTLLEEWKRPAPFDWRAVLACLLGGVLLYPLAARLPVVGWDWYYWFEPGNIDFYPPWTAYLLKPFTSLPWRSGLALLNALTLATVGVAAGRAAFGKGRVSLLGAALLALMTPPVFMALWLGNLEGLVLLGMVALPPGVILALVKPHLGMWAVIARRRWFLWAAGLGILSLLIWGLWPLRTFSEMGRLSQNYFTVGWYDLGWPVLAVGIVLILLSNADPLRLLAAGFFLTPYLMPNHMLLLLPALGRLSGWRRLLLWLIIWLSGVATGMGSSPMRYLVLAFPLAVWLLLGEAQRQPAGSGTKDVSPVYELEV